ncbi:PepSY domain-containing protein [Bacillus sp. FJAT-45037]|uniref:PepSY domain-containing protein n=1 Tax=Bacillus sp. FJAT-45037 TaxID=2011007 RepID=UPI000C245A58|nr:PepSY domain-containing protein [Bacillus sp. FJAT-45037]
MSMKRFALGIGIGLAAGYFLKENLTCESTSPERALKNVKKTVSSRHAISGSWIHMIPETIEREHVQVEVYRGGISTTTETGTVQYEFLADTKTGTLLELKAS